MVQSAEELYSLARAKLAEQRTAEARALLGRAAAACAPSEVELALRITISCAWVLFEDEGAFLQAVEPVKALAWCGRVTSADGSASRIDVA